MDPNLCFALDNRSLAFYRQNNSGYKLYTITPVKAGQMLFRETGSEKEFAEIIEHEVVFHEPKELRQRVVDWLYDNPKDIYGLIFS